MKYEHACIGVHDGEIIGLSQSIKDYDIGMFTNVNEAIEFLGNAGFKMCGVESNFRGVKNMTKFWFVREVDHK